MIQWLGVYVYYSSIVQTIKGRAMYKVRACLLFFLIHRLVFTRVVSTQKTDTPRPTVLSKTKVLRGESGYKRASFHWKANLALLYTAPLEYFCCQCWILKICFVNKYNEKSLVCTRRKIYCLMRTDRFERLFLNRGKWYCGCYGMWPSVWEPLLNGLWNARCNSYIGVPLRAPIWTNIWGMEDWTTDYVEPFIPEIRPV